MLVVLVLEAMASRGGIVPGTAAEAEGIAGAALVQFVMPFLGHPAITGVLRYLSFLFIAVFCVMAALVAPHIDLATLRTHTSWHAWTTAIPSSSLQEGWDVPRTATATRATSLAALPRPRPSGR